MSRRKYQLIPDAGIESRIATVSALYGTRVNAAKAADISTDQLQAYIRGKSTPSFIPLAGLAAGKAVSLDWLWSGQGTMYLDDAVSGEPRESALSTSSFSRRLSALIGGEVISQFSQRTGIQELALNAYLSEELEPTRPHLIRIAAASGVEIGWLATGKGPMKSVTKDERSTYSADAEAAHRPKIRTEVSMARLRAAHEGLEAAQNTVGYQPPVLLQEAIRVLMYSHGLDREGAVILVDFMKRQAELGKAGG